MLSLPRKYHRCLPTMNRVEHLNGGILHTKLDLAVGKVVQRSWYESDDISYGTVKSPFYEFH